MGGIAGDIGTGFPKSEEPHEIWFQVGPDDFVLRQYKKIAVLK